MGIVGVRWKQSALDLEFIEEFAHEIDDRRKFISDRWNSLNQMLSIKWVGVVITEAHNRSQNLIVHLLAL